MEQDKPLSKWETTSTRLKMRRMTNIVCAAFSWCSIFTIMIVTLSILATLLLNGFKGLNFFTFTHMTAPQGLEGGLLNAIIGSIIQVFLGTFLGTPIGVLCGIFLSDYSQNNPLGSAVRFISDMLLSAPSILVGLFIYLVLVAPFGHFSAMAGACSLAVLIIPIIVRTTEDALRLVPLSLREAGAALGAPKWKIIIFVCLPAAKTGILTGILLGIARIAGETAPLLFTSLGNMDWSLDLGKPMASLPLVIYSYIDSANETWINLAWTAALLITLGVLTLNIIARSLLSSKIKDHR